MFESRKISNLIKISRKKLKKIGKRINLIKKFKWIFLNAYLMCSESLLFQTLLNFVFGSLLSFLFQSLIIYILDINQLDAQSDVIFFLILSTLIITYIRSTYHRALFWLLLVYLIIYAIPNLISFVILVKFFKIFLVTLVENLSNLLSILSCSMNLIWTNAVYRANARLKPVAEFMNSIEDLKEQTNLKLQNLTKNEALIAEMFRAGSEKSLDFIIEELIKLEPEFDENFDGLINYLKQKKNEKDLANPKGYAHEEKDQLILNCFLMLLGILKKCKEKVDSIKRECLDRIPVAGYFVCSAVKPKSLCKEILDKLKTKDCLNIDQRGFNQKEISNFIENLESAKKMMKFGKMKVIKKSKLDFNSTINKTDRYTSASIKLADKVKSFFENLLSFWKYLAIFFLTISLYKSDKYLRNYLKDVSFDNKFITNYFIHLDFRRKLESKRNILPLNPLNRSLACELFEFRCLPFEEKNNLSYLTIISIFVLTLLAYSTNYIFIAILEEINKYYLVDIKHNSTVNFHMEILGNGFIAQKMRKIFKRFSNFSSSMNSSTTTRACIKSPNYLDSYQLYFCFLLFFIYAFIKKMYYLICRFRSRLTSLFYPEVEKRRIVYLYNGMLNETLKMFKNSVLNLYSKITGENEKIEFSFHELVIEFRNLLLKYFSKKTVFKLPFINRDRCKVCDSREKKNDFSTKIHFCKRCYLTYCFKCFTYLNSKCLNCDLPAMGINNFSKLENKTRFL